MGAEPARFIQVSEEIGHMMGILSHYKQFTEDVAVSQYLFGWGIYIDF